MKLLFSILRPQIVFGAGGGGGGSVKRGPKGSGNGPTGFADQASRMAKSQRQLGAPQMPGLNFEADKDVPSVAKRKPQRDSSPIDAGSGGFNGGFNKSPKPNKQNGYKFKNIGSRINPITGQKEVQSVIIDPNGNMKKTDYADKFRDSDNRNIGMHQGLAASTGKPRNIKTSSGKLGILPDGSSIKGGIEFDGQGNTYSSSTGNGLDLSGIRGVANPSRPSPIFDDFIPRNSDGSPKYTAPDGSPLRRPYNPSTPARPTMPTPRQPMPQPVLYGGGKGGAGPRPSRPSVPVPPQRPMPVSRPVYSPRVSTPVQSPVPYGGKGGGARPSTQQRRPQMPFTYYRPKR